MSSVPGEENRDLVICNSCSWATSLLKGSKGFARCPACASESLEVIPVNDYEVYAMHMSNRGGIDIEFKKG